MSKYILVFPQIHIKVCGAKTDLKLFCALGSVDEHCKICFQTSKKLNSLVNFLVSCPMYSISIIIIIDVIINSDLLFDHAANNFTLNFKHFDTSLQ